MSRVAVTSIEIDTDTGLLTAMVGKEQITVDVPRVGGNLQSIVSDLIQDLRGRIESGAKDNCDSCIGECCAAGWQIHVDLDDVHTLADGLRKSVNHVLANVVDASYNIAGDGRNYQLRMVEDKRYQSGKRCSMLDVKVNDDGNPVGRCSVYDHRPKTCREYPAHNCDKYIPLSNLVKYMREPKTDVTLSTGKRAR